MKARRRIKRVAEVYVNWPEKICRESDSKGLWKRADRGEITTFPGAGVPYDPPDSPEARVNTAKFQVQEAAHQMLHKLEEQGLFDQKT